MQLTQKHAFWRITRQNRSNGRHTPEPTDMPFSTLTSITDVIIPVKFYVDPLKDFWEGAPPKVPFPILFGMTVPCRLWYKDCMLVVGKYDMFQHSLHSMTPTSASMFFLFPLCFPLFSFATKMVGLSGIIP